MCDQPVNDTVRSDGIPYKIPYRPRPDLGTSSTNKSFVIKIYWPKCKKLLIWTICRAPDRNIESLIQDLDTSLSAASGASEKDGKVQIAIILNCVGPHVLEVCDTFIWIDDGNKDKPDKVLEELERYCNPRDNEVIEFHRFWNIPYQEPFEKFLTEIKT